MAYLQLTPAQLRALFYDRVGQNTAFWRDPDEANMLLQEAFRVFNVMTGFWRNRVDMGLTVQDQVWYRTPADLNYILRMEINQQTTIATTVWDLDYGQPDWECDRGVPQMFAPFGTNLFALWPASAAGGESLIVEGVVPAPLVSELPFVNIGRDELTSVLDYAEHIAQFKEGGQEFEASQVLLQNFLKFAGQRNAMLMQSSRMRGFMGITDERKRPIRAKPDRVGAR